MRKMTAFALVSCLSLGATALVAQTTPSTSMDKPATTSGSMTKTTTTKTTMTHSKASHSHGAITAMDATAKTVTIKDTYNVSDSTKITDGGKAITMGDLKVGDTIYVTYTKNGDKNDASRITVSHPKMKK
jgi:non-ribosomal peptide synthetase component F